MMIAITHLRKLRLQSVLKWVSSVFADSPRIPSLPTGSLLYVAGNSRFYCRERTEILNGLDNSLIDLGQKCVSKVSRETIKGAQAALLEYLHQTRSIPFMDAENMSLNSPYSLQKLLQKVDISGEDVHWSVTRFLWYHPINEFELFFESLGLKPCEFIPLLPCDLMFLSDDDLLLENYFVLCNYGIPRNKIGRIYKEAMAIFRYDYGVLTTKLEAYKRLGLGQSFICKVAACSPYLLIGDVDVDFVKVLEILREGGLEFDWIEGHLLEDSYNWSHMLALLNFFRKEGYSEQQLSGLISQDPGILFKGSADKAISLIGFLFKFGLSMNHICTMFLQFSDVQVVKFASNLRRSFLLLTDIEMEANEIGKIVRSHTLLVGSLTLKRTNSLLAQLNVGKRRLCKVIQENPLQMKKWVLGSKLERLPNTGEKQRSKMEKAKFLLDMGLVEEPNKMEKILKAFRGRGTELQERFDCIMKFGLDEKDVCEILRISPQIFNQKKEVLEKKINFLVNDLGYPISYLVIFPSYLNYTIQRIKLRLAMYDWLKEQGTIDSLLALSTVIACAENFFLKRYVKHHPKGLEVWQDLKHKIYS